MLFILELQTLGKNYLSEYTLIFSYLCLYLTFALTSGQSNKVCFDYLRATKKVDGPYNSSNITKMTANFKLQVCHSHVSEAISLNLFDRNNSTLS